MALQGLRPGRNGPQTMPVTPILVVDQEAVDYTDDRRRVIAARFGAEVGEIANQNAGLKRGADRCMAIQIGFGKGLHVLHATSAPLAVDEPDLHAFIRRATDYTQLRRCHDEGHAGRDIQPEARYPVGTDASIDDSRSESFADTKGAFFAVVSPGRGEMGQIFKFFRPEPRGPRGKRDQANRGNGRKRGTNVAYMKVRHNIPFNSVYWPLRRARSSLGGYASIQ